MREIKFRCWNNNKMEYFPLFWNHPEYINDDAPIMQFTGLKDKNGKDIYEGDIINHSLPIAHEWHGPLRVEWINGGFSVWGGNPCGYRNGEIFNWYPENTEVIGNIHENPELLK